MVNNTERPDFRAFFFMSSGGWLKVCTAISFVNGGHYFGRNLDLEYSYDEKVVITPRNFPLLFRCGKCVEKHYAMIGIAYVWQEYPLYYDALNEKGLCIAALNFPGNSFYQKATGERYAASYELIPWLLSQYATVEQVKTEMHMLTIVDLCIDPKLPATPLHWIVSDREHSVVIEAVRDGVKVYENPACVLTNNPPFTYHMQHLVQYLNLTKALPVNRFAERLDLTPFSKGMGAIGLPGDLSSPSRFVRAAFNRWNAVCSETEEENVCQFFHMLGAVEQQRGCAQAGSDLYEMTFYSSCCSAEKGVYYYRTYTNSQISAVDMQKENLNSQQLICYPVLTEQQIAWQNEKRG